MPKFAKMLEQGMIERGHEVEVWVPKRIAHRFSFSNATAKWLGYVDQFIIFPLIILWRLARTPAGTLFVFADQALGPWVPLVRGRPHVIHVHDFTALKSALGEFPRNVVKVTGRIYQKLILAGFSCGNSFISVSNRTRQDLHCFLASRKPNVSEVVYNGLNFPYSRMDGRASQELLYRTLGFEIGPFYLHVGGNQWYKNRAGVLQIYAEICRLAERPPAMLMIGAAPSQDLQQLAKSIPANGNVVFLTDADNWALKAAYSLTEALIFPSIAEGFGWPIAEALSCGAIVFTSNEPPMTEVGADGARYLPCPPQDLNALGGWAADAAGVVIGTLSRSREELDLIRERGAEAALRFNPEAALDRYEDIYRRVQAGVHRSEG